MKFMTTLLVLPPLAAFVTWLSLGAVNSGTARFDAALDQLDRIADTEAALDRDVLSARAGLLRNYDPLVAKTNALDAEVARLRASMASDAAASAAIDRLADSYAGQEDRVEQFKSINALLQNSLAYFSMFCANLTLSGQDSSLAAPVSMLAAAMLRLTLDTSPDAASAVQARLQQVAQQTPVDGSGTLKALLAHGQLLHDLLPDADSILHSLSSTPRKAEWAAVRAIFLERHNALRADAQRFWIILYITSLCLLGLLTCAAMRLRQRGRAVRRRARFEHVLASISMRFVAARSADLDASIDEALKQMALCVGAERAYFIAGDPPNRVYGWTAPGIAFPPQWPQDALALSRRGYPMFGGVIQVVRLRHLQPGAARDALAVTGLQGWACVNARMTDGSAVLLGFDAVTHPCRIMREGELGLLRMALDTVANALGRRTLEHERERLESQLQHARRLETVGTLASGIAHNFNNIIGAILGYVEMAGERDAPSRTLEEIRRAGERARQLVDQILAFAGRRDTRRSPVDMRAVMTEATSLLRASLPVVVELSMRDTSTAMILSGVHTQLLQVVLNLCNNAAQAMDLAGQVELNVASESVPAPRSLSHGSLPPGRYVRIAVSDRGIGIDSPALERIFEPFFTTKASGTGLGLATVREIVRDHGGAIHVQSTPGRGSRFEVWLPCIEAPAPAPEAESPGLAFGQGEIVLVLETIAERLMQHEDLLAAVGYEPVGFARVEDARAAHLASSGRFDAAVVGHVWPPEALLAFTTELHRVSPDLPILLATPASDTFGATALVTAGISEVVSWPLKAAELAIVLKGQLQPVRQQQIRETAETRS